MNTITADVSVIRSKILEIRGNRVILDYHLAELYGMQTKVLKQAIRRNLQRFPEDFMFEFTEKKMDGTGHKL
ncbi:ORF6N domain-containing protein [Bacteroides heparinolyticus]|uniref:ORF6N domain-containing protein n=1 Tax=Prevotella heparinolytica TaxID=28113 RepID=UPI0035A13703